MSDKTIYWKEFDEPKDGVKGEFVCEDERVKSFQIFGSLSANPSNDEMVCFGIIFFKDGSRWDTPRIKVTVENHKTIYDEITSQAEEYIKSKP